MIIINYLVNNYIILALAKENKIKFLEASAYNNYNVTELFSTIGEEILEKVIDSTTNTPDSNMVLTPGKAGSNK